MPEARLPIVTLTTDFGGSDHYVGATKGAILAVSTQICLVDITHEIAPHDVREAAWTLRNAFQSFPRQTVHLAVVDPGVGTSRRQIAVATENHYFVGPDNGIFSYVFDVEPPARIVQISAPHYMRPEVCPTFHARDVFGPVAAWLARGTDIANFGEEVTEPVRLDSGRPRLTQDGVVRATVMQIDRFGNAVLNLSRSMLSAVMEKTNARGFVASAGGQRISQIVQAYAEGPAGSCFLLYNSSDLLEIAAHQASASSQLGLKVGQTIELSLMMQAGQ